MKKLRLFLFFVLLSNSLYSQYKIKINWIKPISAKPLTEVKKIPPKIIDTVVVKDKLNDNLSLMTIYDFMNNWLGVKYVFGGDSKRGIDCSAFVRRLYSSVYNKKLPRTCYYQYKMVKKVTKDSLTIGDLIFFRVSGGSGWHVGIFIGDNNFLHASGRGRCVMVSSLEEDFYKKVYLSGGRI